MASKQMKTSEEQTKAERINEVFELIAAKDLSMVDVVRGGMLGAAFTAAEGERQTNPGGPVAAAFDAAMKTSLSYTPTPAQQVKEYKGKKRPWPEQNGRDDGILASPRAVYRAVVEADVAWARQLDVEAALNAVSTSSKKRLSFNDADGEWTSQEEAALIGAAFLDKMSVDKVAEVLRHARRASKQTNGWTVLLDPVRSNFRANFDFSKEQVLAVREYYELRIRPREERDAKPKSVSNEKYDSGIDLCAGETSGTAEGKAAASSIDLDAGEASGSAEGDAGAAQAAPAALAPFLVKPISPEALEAAQSGTLAMNPAAVDEASAALVEPTVAAEAVEYARAMWLTLRLTAQQRVGVLLGLDPKQQLVVKVIAAGLNLVVVGGGGVGKTFTLGRALRVLLQMLNKRGTVGSPTHTARRVIQRFLASNELEVPNDTLQVCFGARVGEPMQRDSIAAKVLAPRVQREKAIATARGDFVALDESGQAEPGLLSEYFGSNTKVREALGIEGTQQIIAVQDPIQNLPVQAGTRRLMLESLVITHGNFWFIELNTPHRTTEAESVYMLGKVARQELDEELCAWLQRARDVQLPAGNEFLKEPSQRTDHWMATNQESITTGMDVFSADAAAGDLMIVRALGWDELTRGRRALFKNRVPRELAVRVDGMYAFSATEERVEVGGVTLTNGELLRADVLDWDNMRVRFQAMEQLGQPFFWMGRRAVRAQGMVTENYRQQYAMAEVHQLTVCYDNVGTSYKSQGRSSLICHVHVDCLRGGDNQGYTMLSRTAGSVAQGTLKITGFKEDAQGNIKIEDVRRKLKLFPKSLVVMHLLGRAIPPERLAAARAEALVMDPQWAAVEEALAGRVLELPAGEDDA